MTLKLYLDLLSQPCRSLYILLKQCNVSFETQTINIGKGEQLTDEFKKVSRFQKLPVIINDGFTVTESIAILRYLSKVKKLPETWYPQDAEKQARIDEYLEWQHNNTRLLCMLYFQKKYLFPKFLGKETSPEKLVPYEKNMSKCLDQMETLWLTPGPFINGDKISAADLWAACEIEQPRIAGYEPREGRPILSAWLDRVRESTNPHYDEAHFFLNKLVENTRAEMKSKL